mmetsp:Transcript_14008/g.28848  ORF Transcript_14008/g.28848 Transcript_14008/m.28848 type:complete len:123 (-) Transcript_14008:883-1251(-)
MLINCQLLIASGPRDNRWLSDVALSNPTPFREKRKSINFVSCAEKKPVLHSLQICIILHAQVQRQSEISGSNSVCESVWSQKGRILVGNARQLEVASSLLVGSLEVKVRVGDSVGNSYVPWR